MNWLLQMMIFEYNMVHGATIHEAIITISHWGTRIGEYVSAEPSGWQFSIEWYMSFRCCFAWDNQLRRMFCRQSASCCNITLTFIALWCPQSTADGINANVSQYTETEKNNNNERYSRPNHRRISHSQYWFYLLQNILFAYVLEWLSWRNIFYVRHVACGKPENCRGT